MDNSQAWRDYFRKWPKEAPTRGVLVTAFGEQIPFIRFMTSDSLLVVERQTPDSTGGRQVIIPFSSILALKVVDPVPARAFTAVGFQSPPAKS
jgi:hypothetical protein